MVKTLEPVICRVPGWDLVHFAAFAPWPPSPARFRILVRCLRTRGHPHAVIRARALAPAWACRHWAWPYIALIAFPEQEKARIRSS
jgi:hypothetical protein